MKWSIDRTTTVGLGVALLALVILSIISYLKIQEFQETTFWVQHTQQTTVNIQGLLSHIKDAETGNLGYLLTGNEQYLQPLEAGRAGINAKFDLLQTLTNNNPQQQQQLSLLKRLIVAKLTDIEQTVALRRSQGYEAALGVVQTYKNKHLIDQIHAITNVMKAEESRLLKMRSQAAQVIGEQTTLLIVTNSIFALLVLAIALLRTNSDAYRYQQNKAQYYQIAENLPIIFWMCDANLSKVLYVSPAYEEIWGRTRESLYANLCSFIEAIHPEDREQAIAKIKQNAKIGFEIEYRIIRPDHSIRWICDRGFPIYNCVGQVYRLAGFAQDITESKHSLAQIQQLNETLDGRVRERTAELEAANSQLEAFTYSASHDLREPLRVIASYAQIVLEDYSNQLPAVAIDYLRRILASTQRLERLIENLLTYSRLSRSEIPIQPVALTSIVNDAIAQLNATQQQGMIIVESPLPVVMGNYLTLVQVVSNLLSNAVKFVTPGLTPQVRVYATQQENIRLWVEDNGIGVAPEFQERIFEVFARLHGWEVYPGTGIGLAIVQKGLQRMGGRVGVESQVGEGSRFWIELPAFRKEARRRVVSC